MKKIFLFIILFVNLSSFAQTATKTAPVQLLNIYYDMKDALVSGKADAASAKAGEFVVAINDTDQKIISESSRERLIKDVAAISATKDIKEQRIRFAPFSDNMIELAKKVKLSAAPVYQQYCPMKKASWLSNQQEIRNPYYGSAMLNCGSVKATL